MSMQLDLYSIISTTKQKVLKTLEGYWGFLVNYDWTEMVGDVGNAPTTSAMSMLRSTSELIALNDDPWLSHIDPKNKI